MEGVRSTPPNLPAAYDFLEDIYLCCTQFTPSDRPCLSRVKSALLEQSTIADAPHKARSFSSVAKQRSLPLLTVTSNEQFPLPSHSSQTSPTSPDDSLKSLSAARGGLAASRGRSRSHSFNDLRSLEHDGKFVFTLWLVLSFVFLSF
jgi:hypothetical protein